MDRRHFIKLTAITGTSAALTACGNPENQVIRFIPEEDLVPGIATWKRTLLVDAELSPLRTGRQPEVSDRRPLDDT